MSQRSGALPKIGQLASDSRDGSDEMMMMMMQTVLDDPDSVMGRFRPADVPLRAVRTVQPAVVVQDW